MSKTVLIIFSKKASCKEPFSNKTVNRQNFKFYNTMKSMVFTFFLILLFGLTAKAQYNNDLIIESILKTDTTSLGQKISYPSSGKDEVTMLKIILHPGKTTGWHEHDIPVFAYVLRGTLTVELENKKTLIFEENSSFAEVIHTLHRGTNNGSDDLVLLAIYMGVKGKPLSIKRTQEIP